VGNVDKDRAREHAQTLLDRWVGEPHAHDEQLKSLSAADLASIEMVGALDHSEAGEFLAAVAAGPVTKDVRKGARRGLHRLRASGRSVPSVQLVADHPVLRLNVEYRLVEARASAADGLGSRWLWLFVERSTGGGYFFGMILNELAGIKDVMLSDTTRKRYLERIQDIARNSEIDFHPLPIDYARALMAEGLKLNQASGFTVPADLQTYQSVLGDFGDPPERPLIYDFVSAAEIRLDGSYLEQSAELADEPEVTRWLFDFHDLRPFAEQTRQMDRSLVVVHETAQQERMERIETEALRAVVTDDVRHGLKRRLEETAYIFWITDRQPAAKMAIAAALALEQPIVSRSIIVRVDRGPSQVQHPLIRELLRRSIEMANEIELSGMADMVPRRTAFDPIDDGVY
jgi:hypothetical protein